MPELISTLAQIEMASLIRPLADEIDAGEFDQAMARSEKLLDLTQKMGIPLAHGVSRTYLANLFLELNQIDRAEEHAAKAAQSFEEMETTDWKWWGVGAEARIDLASGRIEHAHSRLAPLWSEGTEPQNSLVAFVFAGPAIAELAMLQARIDWGLKFCNWMVSGFEREEAWNYAAGMRYHRARFYLARGDVAAAEGDLTDARAIAEHAENRVLLWRIDAALAALYMQCGEPERADAPRCRAIELVHAIVIKISDEALRHSFMHHPDVVAALGLLKFDEDR
jgi:tetratricopeptide (TPR) repeat protein